MEALRFGLGLHGYLHNLVPLLTYLGGITIIFLSVFWRPIVGFYFATIILPLQTGRYKLHPFPLGDQFLDLILLGVILGLQFKQGKIIPKTPLNRLLLIIAIFYYAWLWRGALYLGCPLPIFISDPRFSDWKNFVEMFLFCVVAANVIRDEKHARWLLLVMAVSILVANREFYSTVGGRNFSHFNYDLRDSGPLGYAGENGFGSFEAMMGAFWVGVYAYTKSVRWKLAILGLLATCVYCVMFSFSREAYVGFLAAVVFVGAFKERKLLVLVAALLLCWQAVLPGAVKQRIEMTDQKTIEGKKIDPSAAERLTLWENARQLFRENPVFGSGFDTYRFMHRVGPYTDTHNYYVKITVETGLIGLGVFLFLLAKISGLGYKLFRRANNPFWTSVGLGFCAMMLCTIIVNFFGDRWTYQQLDGYLWILLGLVLRGLMIAEESGLEETEPVPESETEPAFEPVTLA